MTEVTLIPGDGTGPELVAATRRVLEATGTALEWDEQAMGDEACASILRTKVAVKGPTDSGAPLLRRELDLYASIRPCKAYEGARTRFPETDLVVVGGLEDSDRPVRAAFEYARAHGRGRVSADGFGRARAVAEEFEDVELDDRPLDGLCGRLVSRPEEYEVIALPGLAGELVADLGAGMIGGRGLAPGMHLGGRAAIFEAAHGTAPEHEGEDRSNPTALMLSGVLMLRHIGEPDAADRLHAAIAEVIRRGETVTYDVKPTRNDPSAVGTSEFADAVIEEMNR